MRTQKARLLVRGQVTTPSLRFGAAGNTFRFEESPHRVAADPKAWQVFEAGGQATIAELWDAAYEQAAQSGAPVEPDCENLVVLPTPSRQRGLFAGGPENDSGIVNEQSTNFPQGPGFAWHLGDNFSQLRSARAAISNPQPVRAAILDVGFDFHHQAMPEHLRKDLQRNFTGDGSPTATDPDRGGFLQNPGHGTATIGILAGRRLENVRPPTPSGDFLGGAPGIEVIPLRIATSVVLFRTSAFVDALNYLMTLQGNPDTAIDLLSMSMGGLASSAWADVVNQAYDSGILLVTAAGNNFGLPKSIVYPARFHRVLAACGIMADFTPYNLPLGTMSGNFGPDSKMDTAIAAFTPNIPWAEIGSEDIVDWDGEGTSAATPQVAAAAALWLQKHKASIAGWDPWQRVEMVRAALFAKADGSLPDSRKYFGRGVVKAFNSLSVRATAQARASLRQQKPDSAAFAFFELLRGTLFRAAPTPKSKLDELFNLELTQLMHRDPNLEQALPDPAKLDNRNQIERFFEAALESPFASARLKAELRNSYRQTGAPQPPASPSGGKGQFYPKLPTERRLQVFAFDPAASRSPETSSIATLPIAIPWEKLAPGPTGEYIEVIDHDPASGCFYAPLDLEDPRAIANNGLPPDEGNPKFHQQMVYAVAMRTIRTFEKALGRRALWSPVVEGRREVAYVPRLRIYPHALRDRNAYYNPLKKALLFGYFPAQPLDTGTINPGGMVFTCLSHDVIAHETSHALLDGMARGLTAPTNNDMLAFHEAFADIVALFQHFALPSILTHELARTHGDLRKRSYLVELAQEFGLGAGLHGALRSYIGSDPDPNLLANTEEPHDRGAILVAAVFDAFVTIYNRRIADLRRIASNGTGILGEGDLHPDLINRFADEAMKAADHVLQMCVRAIDYCPPVDLNFGDFLRAVITADVDLFPADPHAYRPAFIEAFRRRGIYPRDVRTMSEGPLQWHPPTAASIAALGQAPSGAKLLSRLRLLGDIVRRISRETDPVAWPIPDRNILKAWLPKPRKAAAVTTTAARRQRLNSELQPREAVYQLLRQERAVLHNLLEDALHEMPKPLQQTLARELGIWESDATDPQFEIHALNFAERQDDSGMTRRDVIVWIKHVAADGCEGGSTIIANCDTGEIRFLVRKSLRSSLRQAEIARFRASGRGLGSTYLTNTPFAGPGSRFAMIHDSSATSNQEEGYA